MAGNQKRSEGFRRRLKTAGIISILCLFGMLALHFWLFADLPELTAENFDLYRRSIRITDRNGLELYEIIGEEGARHSPVPLESIPEACQLATIATEDSQYYTNPGVDAGAILRALWGNFREGEVLSGASTITQQVVKNLLLSDAESAERTLRRKLREAILAIRLTEDLGKDEILALYLNQTDYGNLAIGIDAASRAYFNKNVNQLGLAECALLAGLPQAPSLYDPLTDPDAANDRQAVVLELMREEDHITEEEATTAVAEPLAFASERYSIKAPHFVMAVIDEMNEILPPDVVIAGGFTITTTLDLGWQKHAEEIAALHLDHLNSPPDPEEPPHNVTGAALVAMDPYTGAVLAMLGSPDFFDPEISGAVNMALAPRQPGSTLKPFTYALSFDPSQPDPWTPATMLLDVRTTFATHDESPYTPVNYDHVEHGPVLIREALGSSYNIPAVLALDHVGIAEMLTFLGELGMNSLPTTETVDLSLTLGGGEVRLLELTAAYGALANGGHEISPELITSITDESGLTLYEGALEVGERVIDERVAYLITDILSDNEARAPAFTTHSILQIGRPAAAKTGTTTDFRDNWTMGYTPNLVVGVWAGNADNSSMINVSGISGASPIWHSFMREVLEGRPELEFERPSGLIRAEVCSLSGLLPTRDCPATRIETFIRGTEPTEYDTIARVITDPRTGREILTLDLPPQAHDWARSEEIPLYSEIADMLDSAASGFLLVAPDDNAVYQIESDVPLSVQRLRFAVSTGEALESVTFILDGAVYEVIDSAPYEVFWELVEGVHTLTAIGTRPDGAQVESRTIQFTVNAP